jgi:uracil-DNA glycosylase
MAVGADREQLRAYVEYFRDMGVYDFYRRGEPVFAAAVESVLAAPAGEMAEPKRVTVAAPAWPIVEPKQGPPEVLIPKLVSFNDLAPLPEVRVARAHRGDALKEIQAEIGDCTRCALAYAGRHKIVFGDGDPGARLMFVGEGPGADEDASGLPFVGKAGQLLNNMIGAMGLKREEVYIANVVKCRPPGNRVPEPAEANTCDQFLLRQMDVVQPEVVVALGATAAMYLLGVKQSLVSLRGRWHDCRGAKLAVTYHPAFLLRDPRQKAEAWKDLQMVMAEMGLKTPAKG